MYGPGLAPPQPRRPSAAFLVVTRVVCVAASMGSIGFLSWIATLRLAVVTRKTRDWLAFWGNVAGVALSVVLLASDPGEDISTWRGVVGILLLLGIALGAVVYYLVRDVRHYRALAAPAAIPNAAPGYGYPGPAAPFGGYDPLGPTQAPGPAFGAPAGPVGAAAVPPPASGPRPARIDQVRAELDELSDYLRRHDGERGPQDAPPGGPGAAT
ncbi:hypothetical protein [Streptomyces sp. NPDC050560]|uniref:hypothetical protein n=1 Tax=Streptomyces sp. NPDC050560 TaxID=3365630 RepID=UPI0037ACBC76